MIKLKSLLLESVVNIPIEKLDYFKWYLEGGCDEEHDSHKYGDGDCILSIKNLAEKFKKQGYFLEPIEVKYNNGRWLVMDGHHRVNAAVLAGLKSIPSIVVTK